MTKYTLNKLNVVKVVTDKELVEKYKAKGFKIIKEEVENENVDKTIERTDVQAEVFVCPHCNKEYKTENGLKKHIEREHTEKQEGDN